MSKTNWKEVNDRYVLMLRPSTNAVGMKYFKIGEEDQIEKTFPGVEYFTKPTMTCQAIGVAAYYNKIVCLRRNKDVVGCNSSYCAANNGLAKKDENWWSGHDMATYPFEWFGSQEASKQHTEAQNVGCPDDIAAIVCYSLAKCDVEPDVIAMSMLPGAAYHLLGGLIEKDFKVVDFMYTQESGCTDSWGLTYLTGKPGLSLGCRGDRSLGALPAHELRLSMKPADFLKALEGTENLAARDITYPYYPVALLLQM